MYKPLVGLIVFELVALVWLGSQLFAAPAARIEAPGAAASLAPMSPTAPRVAAAAGAATASPDAAPSALSPAAASERAAVAAAHDPSDPVGILLTGSLRWRDGGVIPGASISATRGDLQTTGSAGADGSYALVRLAPGEWELSVRVGREVEHTQQIAVDGQREQRLDIVLDRTFPLRVLAVTTDGKDLVAMMRTEWNLFVTLAATAAKERLPERFAPADTGLVQFGDSRWDGKANPVDGLLGTLHMRFAPPGYAALMLRHVVVGQQPVAAGQQDVKFVVGKETLQRLLATITVRVVSAEDQQPLVAMPIGPPGMMQSRMGRPLLADGGVLRLDAIEPGGMQLQLIAPGRERYRTTLTLEPGQQLDLGTIALAPDAPLLGRVVDGDGKPAAAVITWTELKWRTTPTPFHTSQIVQTQAAGEFSLDGTGPGRIAVAATSAGGSVAVGVFDNPPATPVVLSLQAAAAVRFARLADASRSCVATLFAAGRDPIAAVRLSAQSPTTVQLPLGAYRFEVHEHSRLVQGGEVALGAGGVDVEVR